MIYVKSITRVQVGNDWWKVEWKRDRGKLKESLLAAESNLAAVARLNTYSENVVYNLDIELELA